MATASTGGQPTTTSRTYNWSGNIGFTSVYTCPANTFCEVNLARLDRSASQSGSAVIGFETSSGFSGTIRYDLGSFAGGVGAGGYSFNVDWGNGAPIVSVFGAKDARGRQIEGVLGPLSSATAQPSVYSNRFILYPGESIFVESSGVGNPSLSLRFSTIEVTAGS
jgi:hypothetical protein